MKKFAFVFTAAAVLAAAPLSAQGWAPIGIPDNNVGDQTPEYWDNRSSDGVSCNSGFILTGSAGPCSNQTPNPWLPIDDLEQQTEFFHGAGGIGDAPTLLFGSGTYTISLLGGFQDAVGGDVAGVDPVWGYFTDAADPNTFAELTGLNGDKELVFENGTTWGLWVTLTNGSIATSTNSNQFAMFGNEATRGETAVIGIEDILTRNGGGDRDFNDMMFRITAGTGGTTEIVPEPATMTMLATGLVGMAAARRRRKNNG